MSNIRINKYVAIALFIATSCFSLFFNDEALSLVENTQELVINVSPLNSQDIDITSKFVGYIIPINSVEVIANVSGYIDEIWAKGGKKVEYGDNLILIDQRNRK